MAAAVVLVELLVVDCVEVGRGRARREKKILITQRLNYAMKIIVTFDYF
jgi:hypothetical protein